jgi:Xaa-Pro aminopeptidase
MLLIQKKARITTMTRDYKAKNTLAKHSADYILITDSVSVRYFSGFSSSNAALLISADAQEKYLFTDFRYKTLAQNFCAANGYTFIEARHAEFPQKINSVLRKNAIILFQSNYFTVEECEFYKKKIANALFIRAADEIDEIFYEKTPAEINSLRKAAETADISFAQWLPKLACGMSEFEAARMLDIICMQNGSEKASFDTIVLFGEHAALPHGVPSRDRKLSEGDFILCDFGCVIDGFGSDMTRTVCFGEARPADKKIYEIVLAAQLIGLKAVKAGAVACEIDKKVRDYIAGAGYGDKFGHGTGHSVGLRIHENPAINKNDKTILTAGMVVTVEPGIYIEGSVGVRIEDLVVVGEESCEILSKTTKILQSI